MILLSVTGLFKMLLIILGVFLLLRLIGRLMIAKRNIDEHHQVDRERNAAEDLKRKSAESFGKTTISKLGKSNRKSGDFVDFEEVKED